MPGIVRGEASSCTTPLLPFFYQVEGILADLAELRFEVYPVGSATKVTELTLDLRLAEDGGHKVATGYYVAPLDPLEKSMSAGPYEIVWHYRATGNGPWRNTSYFFEVLDPRYFRSSLAYEGYISSAEKLLNTWELHERQSMIDRASKEVNRLTMRFFFPRHIEHRITVRKESTKLWLDEPIIGVGVLTITGGSPVFGIMTETEVGLTGIRVYNRHLDYVLSPDDRENPGIEYLPVASQDLQEYGMAKFPAGSQNVKVTGAFGYTDPNGAPFGETPRPLRDVVLALAYRFLKDPLGQDPTLWSPNRVEMAKTRDQQIKFGSVQGSGAELASMTGDSRLDAILAPYCRPWHVGVAGG